MKIEIQKNVITTMSGEDVVQYELVPMEDNLMGSLDDLKELSNFLVTYIDREEGRSLVPHQD